MIAPWTQKLDLCDARVAHSKYAAAVAEARAAFDSGSAHPEGDIYEVDKLLRDRTTYDGRRQFLVRWKGYGDDLYGDTWEDEASILDRCLVYDYDHQAAFAKQKHKPQAKKAELGTGSLPSAGGEPPRKVSRKLSTQGCTAQAIGATSVAPASATSAARTPAASPTPTSPIAKQRKFSELAKVLVASTKNSQSKGKAALGHAEQRKVMSNKPTGTSSAAPAPASAAVSTADGRENTLSKAKALGKAGRCGVKAETRKGDEVRAALKRLGFSQYIEKVVEEMGYDDRAFLRTRKPSELREIGVSCGMKPGHAHRFSVQLNET